MPHRGGLPRSPSRDGYQRHHDAFVKSFVQDLARLLQYKFWNSDSTASGWLCHRVVKAVRFPSSLALRFRLRSLMRGYVQAATPDTLGGDLETKARIVSAFNLLAAELANASADADTATATASGSSGKFFGGEEPSSVDAQVFGLMMQVETCDPHLYDELFDRSNAVQRQNLVELQQRIWKVKTAFLAVLDMHVYFWPWLMIGEK